MTYPPQQPPPGGYYPPGGYSEPGYQPPGAPSPQGFPSPGPQGFPPPDGPGFPPSGPQGFPPEGYGPQQQQQPYGHPGYPPPRPPKRGHTAVWVSVILVVVLAAVVVGVGGFLWPGWFRSNGLPHGHDSFVGLESADALFQAVEKDAVAHNAGALRALACPASELEGIDQLVTATRVTLQGKVTHNGANGAVVEMRVETPTGAELYGVGTTNQLTGRWCIASITPGGSAN